MLVAAGPLGRAGWLELVRGLMRELGLVACQPRPWRPSTTQQGQAGPVPDLVNRDFSATVPGAKMVGDITYIATWRMVFLATVIDCATRKVIGWAMDDNYRTPLITSAIEMAARNLAFPLMRSFTQDRGSNYTDSPIYLEVVAQHADKLRRDRHHSGDPVGAVLETAWFVGGAVGGPGAG